MNKAKRHSGRCVPSLMTILCFTALWFLNSTILAESLPASDPDLLTDAEKWVNEQVAQGKDANLKEKFADKANRVLRANFLKGLLTIKPPRDLEEETRVIRIVNAVVTEPVNIENEEIFQETELKDCQFEDELNFSGSWFHKRISFEQSSIKTANFRDTVFKGPVTFRNAEIARQFEAQKARFRDRAFFDRMKVEDRTMFNEAVFEGPVFFNDTEITRQFEAQKAHFCDRASFHRMKVRDRVVLNNALFKDSVTFSGAEIRHFEARGTNFTGIASFDRMKVGDSVVLNNAVFKGSVTFSGAELRHFEAREAHFSDRAFFDRMKVGDIARFNRAEFNGPAIFNYTEIARQFDASDTEFKDRAFFHRMKVGDRTMFNRAVFAGQMCSFDDMEIRYFDARQAHFLNTSFFAKMKVGDTAFFNEAVFKGKASFSETEIVRNLWAEKAQFTFQAGEAESTNIEPEVSFAKMKVGDTAFFNEAVFKGSVTFNAAEIGEFKANEVQFTNLDLSLTVIRRGLQIENLRVRDMQDMTASFLQVGDRTSLKGLRIEGKADFRHSSFGILELCNVYLAQDSKSRRDGSKALQLDGMTCNHIDAGNGEDCSERWDELDNLHKKAEYSASAYANLEAYFRRQGNLDAADEVFVTRKRHEREVSEELVDRLWSYFLDILVLHGRSPERAFFWGALIVFIGYWVFRRRDGMDPPISEDTPHRYSALWYSLDLFLPLIDLRAASIWIPKKSRRGALIYMRIHTILGWILTSIGIAALTGIIE